MTTTLEHLFWTVILPIMGTAGFAGLLIVSFNLEERREKRRRERDRFDQGEL